MWRDVLAAAAADWVTAVSTAAAALPGLIAAVYAFRAHSQVKTPSGDRLGDVVERTHDLTSADLALTTAIHSSITNGHTEGAKNA